MGSIIKVNEYKDFGNNAIMTSDGAGVVTVNADGLKNVPAFEATLSAEQDIGGSNTITKIQFNSVNLDTNSDYDNSTNYRFTPTIAGKYFVYSALSFIPSAGGYVIKNSKNYVYKNGAQVLKSAIYLTTAGSTHLNEYTMYTPGILDMNGSSDYIESYGQANPSSGDVKLVTNSLFGAYKLIGA